MPSMGAMTLSPRGKLSVFESVNKNQNVAATGKESTLEKNTAAPVEGVNVTISGAALKAAGAQKTQASDIEDSGLPDTLQKMLKMIRELKKQIAEKQLQLQQVMTNSSLSPEQVRAQASALQAELASLSAGLITLNAGLAKAMNDLSAEEALKTAAWVAT